MLPSIPLSRVGYIVLVLHCKDKIPKFQNKYSQKRNIGVAVPISTFMRLWVIYIFSRSVSLFCWRKYVDRSWDYINRSQAHECWSWGWGRAIPRKGIHKGDFRCSVVVEPRGLEHQRVRIWNCEVRRSRILRFIQDIVRVFKNKKYIVVLWKTTWFCPLF